MLQGLAGGLVNPQVSGLVQQMFSGAERGRAFGVLGTTVGVGTAIGPLVGGALIALGGPSLGWRLVFFVNIPIGILVIFLARRLLPAPTESTPHRLDYLGAALLGGATFCVLFACVQYDALRDARLAWLGVPALVLGVLFFRRERRLTERSAEPLVDFRLFRQPVVRLRHHAGPDVLPGHGRPAPGARDLLPAGPRLLRDPVRARRHGVRRGGGRAPRRCAGGS